MSIRAIHNDILFQFKDRVNSKGQFEEGQSYGGIILNANHSDSAKKPRWVKIVSLGPDVNDELRTSGIELLVEHLMWTPGVKYEGQSYWKTDDTKVLGYRLSTPT